MTIRPSIIYPVLVVGLLCGAVAWYQHQELQTLREKSAELAKEKPKASSSDSPADLSMSAEILKEADEREAEKTAKGFMEELSSVDFQDQSEAAENQKREFLGRLAAMDASALQALLDQLGVSDLPVEVTEGLSSMALSILAEKGHGRIAANRILADSLPPRAFVPVLRAWASKAPGPASQWLEEKRLENLFPVEQPEIEREISKAIVAGLAAADPGSAFKLAAATEGSERNQLLSVAAKEIKTDQGWLAFARQASDSKDEQFRFHALLALSNGTLHNKSFEDVRHLVDQLGLDATIINPFIRGAATRQIDDKTAERAEWMIERSSPENVNENMRQLMTLWTANDYKGAAAWLQELEHSEVKDVAVRSFAEKVAEHEPESALDWAKTIRNAEMRKNAIDQISPLLGQ